MSDEEVRIVTLAPMRVASFHGFGSSPEYEALGKLLAWGEPRGLLSGERQARVFGFNNPEPSPGSPNYGYEFWLEVGPEVPGEEGAEIKEFSGGQYAVLRCHAEADGSNIGAGWQQLVIWQEASRYRYPRQLPCLEQHLGPLTVTPTAFTLDLYLPIAEESEG